MANKKKKRGGARLLPEPSHIVAVGIERVLVVVTLEAVAFTAVELDDVVCWLDNEIQLRLGQPLGPGTLEVAKGVELLPASYGGEGANIALVTGRGVTVIVITDIGVVVE